MSTTTVITRIAQETGDLILLESGDLLLADGLFSDVFPGDLLTLTLSTPAPAVSGGAVASPDAVVLTLSLPAPLVFSPDVKAQPDAVVMTLSIPAVVVIGEANVAPDELSIVWSVPAPTIYAERFVTIEAGVFALTLTPVSPRRVGGVWQPIGREGDPDEWTALERSSASSWTEVPRVE